MEQVKTAVKDPHSHPCLLCACLCLRGFVSLSLVEPNAWWLCQASMAQFRVQ